MLIVTREIGEDVIIDHDIRVVVMDVMKGHTVRLGIAAPGDVEIWRGELYEEVHPEGPPA